MRIDTKRLCYLLRSHYPETFGIRSLLQKKKVARIKRFLLTEDEIIDGEQDLRIRYDISRDIQKDKKRMAPIKNELEYMIKEAPLFKNKCESEIQILINEIVWCYFAYGFLPSEFIAYDFINRSVSERKMFISELDTKVFGYSVNNIRKLQGLLDKGESYKLFSKYFKRDAVVIEGKNDYDTFVKFVGKNGKFVKKEVFSCMGKGTTLVDINDFSSLQDVFDLVIDSGKTLLEELIVQHDELSKFHPCSVNTIRCIVFKTYDNTIAIPYCFFKTGRNGSFVDNGGKGGILIGIDVETGILSTDGRDEFNNIYEKHPDTGIRFKGSTIPFWNEMKAICSDAAKEVEGMNYLSFDMALSKEGWKMIEVNEVGQLIGPQTVSQQGIKPVVCKYYNSMQKMFD